MVHPLRFALLGAGSVAELYLPVFRHLPQAQLLALADIDTDSLHELGKKYAIERLYTSVEAVAADPDIDGVIVGTPPNLHAAHIECCARAGKHVLCEKPMAATVADCRRIIEACERAGVKLQMAHMKRFMRGNQRVKALVDRGILGQLFMAECHWDCAVPQLVGTYREQAVTVGGNLQDHGPHAFDLVRWWSGLDIQRVSASIQSVHPQRPTEDAAVAILEHEQGFVSYHHMTRISYGREHGQDTYRLYGTEGTLVVRNDHHFPTMSLESPEIVLYRPGRCVQRFETEHGWNIDDSVVLNDPFYNQVKAFCECIRDNSEPRVSGADGRHVIEAVVAAYVSSVEGRKVELPLDTEPDLAELFKAVKERDNQWFQSVPETDPLPTIELPEHLLAHCPPRSKEKWSDQENGQIDRAGWHGLMRRLRIKLRG